MNATRSIARENLLVLANNPYPGRGLIVGLSEDGQYFIQVYWIMGRSENSRNRVFIFDDNGGLETAAADPKKVKDPSLIIYQAMAEKSGKYFAVSNGHQTKDAIAKHDLLQLSEKWSYEPDEPNFTPRITAMLVRKEYCNILDILILKKEPFGAACVAQLFRYNSFFPGLGMCVTTYSGDGNPLPSFTGEPYLLPLTGDAHTVAHSIWDSLNEENRVSLAVKLIDRETDESVISVINKHQIVG